MNAIVLRPARSVLAELAARQKFFARAGWLMLGVAVACLVLAPLGPHGPNGLSVWIKPAKFAASFVALFWTLAWVWETLAPGLRESPAARLLAWGVLLTAGAEQVWMTARAALALPSHFVTTGIGAVIYPLMGVIAVMLVTCIALLGVLILLKPDRTHPLPWRLAVGLGLALAGVLGGFTGYGMAAHGASRIGGSLNDAGNFAPFFWSRDGGDLRVAHFLGIHAMQAIPALALLGAGTRLVAAGAAGWTALTLAAYAAAMRGLPLSP